MEGTRNKDDRARIQAGRESSDVLSPGNRRQTSSQNMLSSVVPGVFTAMASSQQDEPYNDRQGIGETSLAVVRQREMANNCVPSATSLLKESSEDSICFLMCFESEASWFMKKQATVTSANPTDCVDPQKDTGRVNTSFCTQETASLLRQEERKRKDSASALIFPPSEKILRHVAVQKMLQL